MIRNTKLTSFYIQKTVVLEYHHSVTFLKNLNLRPKVKTNFKTVRNILAVTNRAKLLLSVINWCPSSNFRINAFGHGYCYGLKGSKGAS